MVGYVADLAPYQQRELLTLLTQESTELQTDEEILAGLSETLRRQLSLGAATDLAEGFRRRMIRVAEELGPEPHPDGYYDFRSDRVIAKEIVEQVRLQANALSSNAEGEFMVDFTKSFKTMSQDRRAAWLRKAALAASAAEPDAVATQHAAEAAKKKSSAHDTALSIAEDVAGIVYIAARKKAAARASSAASAVDAPPPKLAAAPLGLVAGGAVAYMIRQRRRAARQKADEDDMVQVRRERQATQAVVTTCAYVLAAVEED
jgi:hypothetical protein